MSPSNLPTPPGNTPQSYPSCVEHGVWAPIPVKPPDNSLHMKFKDVDPNESRVIRERGVMTFHAVGCSGDFKEHQPGLSVANAMAAQIPQPGSGGGIAGAVGASFLFHLGDIVYKDEDATDPAGKDQAAMYGGQFYGQFANYAREIFAIAGNHDAKISTHKQKSAIDHFLENFCDSKRRLSPDSQTATSKRLTMNQPYPYWLFETSLCYIVGLSTNDINGGQLDNPTGGIRPQYEWLVTTLKEIKAAANGKVIFIALHYPPFSGAANFAERGNPNLGPTPRNPPPGGVLYPLGNILQHAFQDSGQYPDVVLSAHAHLYQRITYTYASGWQIPYVIAGSGGHGPIEKLSTDCSGNPKQVPATPFDVVAPPGLAIPKGDSVQVVKYNDSDFGFLRLTVEKSRKIVTGEFFAVPVESKPGANLPVLFDSFALQLDKHIVS
jgi:acid phosphatase type 7